MNVSPLAAAPPARALHFAVFALALAYLLTPDCCLNGHHGLGFGMFALGPICHAAAD